jgi:putative transposase
MHSAAGRKPCPSLVIMDGQSVKTTERGGVRGFDGHKLIKRRKRHILVDTLGLIMTRRVAPAGVSDQRAGARLLGGLRPFFPAIRTVMADAGHQSRKLARALKRHEGWELVITKRGQRAFKVKGLTWAAAATLTYRGTQLCLARA